jgi:hypothetical protein
MYVAAIANRSTRPPANTQQQQQWQQTVVIPHRDQSTKQQMGIAIFSSNLDDAEVPVFLGNLLSAYKHDQQNQYKGKGIISIVSERIPSC